MTADLPAFAVQDGVSTAWGTELRAAGCTNCGQSHLLEPNHSSARCPACYAAELVPQPARVRPEPPELYLPFTLDEARLAAALESWARGVWLRPPELAGAVLRSRLSMVYLPMWLVDAEVVGHWHAQAGYDYQVASTQESYRGGQWVTHRLTETRIRWEPRAGQLRRGYQNVAVPAVDDHGRLIAGLGPFAVESARPFEAAAVRAAAVRVPDLDPSAAWPFARQRLEDRVAADCQTAAGAQHIDQIELSVKYSSQHWTQLLLPVYTTAYRDDDGRWIPVYIHGQTGQIMGVRRASLRQASRWTGVAAAIAVAIFLLSLLLSVLGALLPPVVILAGGLLLASLVFGLLAPIPVVWAWQYNRGR